MDKDAKTDGDNEKKSLSKSKKNKHQNQESVIKTVPYYRLFQFSTWMDMLLICLGSLCSIICGVMMPVTMLVFGQATGDIIDYVSFISTGNLTDIETQEAGDDVLNDISTFAINMSLIGLVTVILSYVGNTAFCYTSSRQAYVIRKLYLSSILNQDIGWYDVHQTGDFASSMTENLAKIEEGMGEKLAIFLFCEAVFASGIILSLIFGWELALISFVSLPISSLSMSVISLLSSKFAQKEMDAYGAASAVAEEVFSAIRTVVAFEGQKVESERYTKNLIHAMNNNIRRSLFSGLNSAITWFCIFASYAFAFWYGVGLIIREKELPADEVVYTAGNVVSVFLCTVVSTWYFGIAAPYVEVFSAAQGAAVKIFDVIENQPIINLSKSNGKSLKNVRGNISFKNVHFEYPSRTGVKVLNGLNLNIKSGEKVALVGSSGCGKSTTIQLIQRFYDPLAGEVCLDDHNIKDFDLKWLRSNIGVVSQEPALFATTIYENIRYGNQSATRTDIETAARKALAHDFIARLPQGYNTVIGERGAQLSGGQKQRIAIARALVREPRILLLDEATSALDTTSEAMVQLALDNAANECTTIIVAHRLSTVRNADRILVLSNGEVAEEGSHQELITKKGLYYNLVTSQEGNTTNQEDSKSIITEIPTEVESTELTNPQETSNETEGIEDAAVINKVKAVMEVIKLNKPEWLEIFIGCVASVVTGAAMPAYSIVFGDFVGVLSVGDDVILRKESNLYCLYFLIIGITTATATFLQIYMFTKAGEKLTKRVRGMMFETMMNQEIGWFDHKENSVGALCTRLSSEAATLQGASGQCIGTLLNSLATFTIAACLALLIHWRIALVALSFSPLIFMSVYYEQKIVGGDQVTKKSLESSAKTAIEATGNIRTVASLGCEETFCQLYDANLLIHHSATKNKSHFRGIMIGLSRGLMGFCYAATIYYGTELVVWENLDYSVLFKVAECVVVGAWSVGNAVAYAPNFQKGLTAAHEVFKILQRLPKIRSYSNALTNKWTKGAIIYNDIHFSYPTRPNVPILRGLNLSVMEGKTVALVGSSGCGKSTLIQLLERFYDPNRGEILADGNPLHYIDLNTTRSQLGIVSQEPNLFNRSIYENIVYGANGRKVTMEEVIDVSRKANIYSFISSLPLGYDTNIGERATHLSGGQKQRIAIARALIRNPKVLLLDEATSALDNESEKVVQEALDNAKAGRTCITIAHRLTTIQDADVICVVNEGRVAEVGKHSELLSMKGLYYRFYTLQSGH